VNRPSTGLFTSHDRLGGMSDVSVVSYRLRPALGLRMIGVGFVWLAAFVVLEVLRASTDWVGGAGFGVLRWVFAVGFVLIAGAGAVLILDPRPGLLLDENGFRNRTSLRRSSVRQARWDEVKDVVRTDGGGGPTVVIQLNDGRRSTVVGNVLNAPLGEIEQRIRTQLNDAHGYRPLT
jgi:hypothetical protein